MWGGECARVAHISPLLANVGLMLYLLRFSFRDCWILGDYPPAIATSRVQSPCTFEAKKKISAREETMRFSEGKNRISPRVDMAVVVLVALAAFACLTGCSNGQPFKAVPT